MTVSDMRCDRCGTFLVGPEGPHAVPGRAAVRFLYHPGNFALRDDSGLLCDTCADRLRGELGPHRKAVCASCDTGLEHDRSMYLYLGGEEKPWQFCPRHAAGFLNTLRTVEPKLDAETFTLSGDWPSMQKERG